MYYDQVASLVSSGSDRRKHLKSANTSAKQENIKRRQHAYLTAQESHAGLKQTTFKSKHFRCWNCDNGGHNHTKCRVSLTLQTTNIPNVGDIKFPRDTGAENKHHGTQTGITKT